MSSYIVSNLVVLIIAVIYWNSSNPSFPFRKDTFWMGFISSSFYFVGSVCSTKAYSLGPAGPVSASTCICNVGLVFVEAVKNWKWLSNLQTVGAIFGIFGSGMLVLPDEMERYVLCCFFQEKLKKQKMEKEGLK